MESPRIVRQLLCPICVLRKSIGHKYNVLDRPIEMNNTMVTKTTTTEGRKPDMNEINKRRGRWS